MTWDQHRIRRTFLDYFAKHPSMPHREVPSSPIMPTDDPTLLFTNAGMNQFKAALLGQEKRAYNRACSVQKCMRVGGKHNDLNAVGRDGRHLTWFEMLGNWSFGDYYKEDTIRMAWDLSVEVYGLDAGRIYISVYKDDDESYALWRDVIGVPEARIYRFGDLAQGDDENYWSMGPTGPCGPCTELFYDLGPEGGTGPEDYMGGEGDRYMEFWNNVFMQNNRLEDGTLQPLAQHGVDTGMGMERVAMLLQGKVTAYETDLFVPIIETIEGMSGARRAHPTQKIDLQVIADHIRSLTFTLSEGGQFSNEGRGYVLRRILRRAVRHGRRIGFEGPFLHRLAPTVAAQFEGVYELPKTVIENTQAALEEEEARFFRTIDRGMARIYSIIEAKKAAGEAEIAGQEAFELYDTYGFPVDLTRIEAETHGFTVDEPGFEAAMEAQRARSRQAGGFYEDAGGAWQILTDGGGDGFAGYGLETLDAKVMRWRQSDDRVEFILQRTPLYAESGGEVADHGTLSGPGFEVAVTDVQSVNGIIHHIGAVTSGAVELDADSTVTATVDLARRGRKTIHHTATHLLHAALKALVGEHVQQKGSVVEPDRLRFDFSHHSPLSDSEIEAMESWVNTRIRRNEPVVKTEGVPIDEAKAQGVVALFGEKYGDLVRTVRAGGDSFELCGGNHTDRTGDIGHVRVTGQSAVSAGVRRIEAVVGHAADALARDERQLIRAAAEALKTDVARLPQRVEQLLGQVKALEKALEKARRTGGAVDPDALIAAAVDVAGAPLITAAVEVDARETLAALVDRIRDKRPDAVVVLMAALEDGKVAVIAAVGPTLKKDKRFHAGKIIKAVTAQLDGRGGGRPDFAQGGGQSPEKMPAAVAAVPGIVQGLAG